MDPEGSVRGARKVRKVVAELGSLFEEAGGVSTFLGPLMMTEALQIGKN